MNKFSEEIKIYLTGEELKKLAGQYHFEEKDLGKLLRVYETVQKELCVMSWVRVFQEQELSFVDYPQCAVVLVTLSSFVDSLQDSYQQDGFMLEAYMVECIGFALLEKAYQIVNERIYQRYGLWIKSYDFFGDKFSVEYMPGLFALLEQEEVHINHACMMSPKKSVLYLGELSGERSRHIFHVCTNCKSHTCENRKAKEEAEQGKQKGERI